jgi:large subunit ribosomal protein L4
MPQVALYNVQGEQVGELELNKDIFGVQPHRSVLHEAVVKHLAGRRRGTHDTKTRAEVSGGGRKPWRQKGTGRARHGSIRSPIWRGGGIVFGPHPRDYGYNLPRKVRRLALKSALSAKAAEGKVVVLDELKLAAPRTKEMLGIIANLRIAGPVLLVTAARDENIIRSARNIPGVKTVPVEGLNTYDILAHETLLLTKDALARVEEVFSR